MPTKGKSKGKEQQALEQKGIHVGDTVRTAYRGGVREGKVEEVTDEPKVVFTRRRPGQAPKQVRHNPSTLEKVTPGMKDEDSEELSKNKSAKARAGGGGRAKGGAAEKASGGGKKGVTAGGKEPAEEQGEEQQQQKAELDPGTPSKSRKRAGGGQKAAGGGKKRAGASGGVQKRKAQGGRAKKSGASKRTKGAK